MHSLIHDFSVKIGSFVNMIETSPLVIWEIGGKRGATMDRNEQSSSEKTEAMQAYYSERVTSAVDKLYSSCMAHDGDPLAQAELGRRVERAEEHGVNVTDLFRHSAYEMSGDGSQARVGTFKSVDPAKPGHGFELYSSCTFGPTAVTVDVDKDGAAKINGKTVKELERDGDKVLTEFAAAQFESPIAGRLAGVDLKSVVYAPVLSKTEQALATSAIQAKLSGNEAALSEFAKAALRDPESASRIMAGMNWRDNGSAFELVDSEKGKEMVFTAGLFGQLRIDASGRTEYAPSPEYTSMTKEGFLKHVSEFSRTRISADLSFAESIVHDRAWFPALITRRQPGTLAEYANMQHSNDFHKSQLRRSEK